MKLKAPGYYMITEGWRMKLADESIPGPREEFFEGGRVEVSSVPFSLSLDLTLVFLGTLF